MFGPTTTGMLPEGITFSTATGLFSGTPTAIGDFTFGVTVIADAAECAPSPTSTTMTLKIVCGTFSLSSHTLADGDTSTPYSVTLVSTGGGTKTYTASTLPAGLALSTAGVISGTPTVRGKFEVVVNISTAQAACWSTQSVLITIRCGALNIGSIGSSGTTMDVAGGTPPFTFETSGKPKAHKRIFHTYNKRTHLLVQHMPHTDTMRQCTHARTHALAYALMHARTRLMLTHHTSTLFVSSLCSSVASF